MDKLRITFQELAKAGILFLVMGIGLFFFGISVREELTSLRNDNKELQKDVKQILINQVNEGNKVIDKNNQLLFENNRILAIIKNNNSILR